MDVLWDHGGWLTSGQVHTVLAGDGPIAYTTVMTILVRLCEKGRCERQRDGRAYAYRPYQTREEHAAARMGEMLTGVGDRTAVLNRFVRGLAPADVDQARRMLLTRHGG